MFRKWVEIAFVGLVVVSIVAACARKPAVPTETPTAATLPFPTGQFTNNDWSWDFKADGTFTFSGPQMSETGTYTPNGDQVVITCQCGGNVKGTYGWLFDGQTLTFHAIDDPIFNRLNVISSGVWSLNP